MCWLGNDCLSTSSESPLIQEERHLYRALVDRKLGDEEQGNRDDEETHRQRYTFDCSVWWGKRRPSGTHDETQYALHVKRAKTGACARRATGALAHARCGTIDTQESETDLRLQ